jgi:hypothetical protein
MIPARISTSGVDKPAIPLKPNYDTIYPLGSLSARAQILVFALKLKSVAVPNNISDCHGK